MNEIVDNCVLNTYYTQPHIKKMYDPCGRFYELSDRQGL